MAVLMIAAMLCFLLVLHERTLAQLPPRPVLPKSYYAMGSAEYLGGNGQFVYANDDVTGKTLQAFRLTQGCQAVATYLARYDTGRQYKIFNVGPIPMCTPMASGGNPPPGGIFEWVDSAVYQGRTDQLVLGVSLDFWASNMSGRIGDILLGVSPNNSNVPVALWFKGQTTTSDVLYMVDVFNATAPPSSVFYVPSICGPVSKKPQMQFHQSDTQFSQMIMPPFMFDPTGKIYKSMVSLF